MIENHIETLIKTNRIGFVIKLIENNINRWSICDFQKIYDMCIEFEKPRLIKYFFDKIKINVHKISDIHISGKLGSLTYSFYTDRIIGYNVLPENIIKDNSHYLLSIFKYFSNRYNCINSRYDYIRKVYSQCNIPMYKFLSSKMISIIDPQLWQFLNKRFLINKVIYDNYNSSKLYKLIVEPKRLNMFTYKIFD